MAQARTSSGTHFATSTGDKAIVVTLAATAGIALGFLLPWLASFATEFPIPFGGAIEKLSEFDSPTIVALRPVIGGALGVVAGFVVAGSNPTVTVSADRILVRKNGETRALAKNEVGGIHRARGKIVIETPTGRILFDDEIDGAKQQVADAFVEYGYPWEMTV